MLKHVLKYRRQADLAAAGLSLIIALGMTIKGASGATLALWWGAAALSVAFVWLDPAGKILLASKARLIRRQK